METQAKIGQQALDLMRSRLRLPFEAGESRHLVNAYIEAQSNSMEVQCLQEMFKPLVVISQKYEKFKIFCGKVLKVPQGQKYLKMFRCYTCSQESNSILCIECFEKSNHKDHRFEMIKILGGICDCGDKTKWKKTGFCSDHRKDKDTISKATDQVHKSQFKETATFAFQSLCRLYQRLQQFMTSHEQKADNADRNLNKMAGELMKEKVDKFGELFLNALIQANQDHLNINYLTRQWLKSEVQHSQEITFIGKEHRTIIEQLFFFVRLQKTAKAYVPLCQILFIRGGCSFKEEITVTYFRFYSQTPSFLRSGYTEFSHQLFSSSNLINGLIRKNNMCFAWTNTPLRINLPPNQIEEEIKEFGKCYKAFYSEMEYFLEAKQQKAAEYWAKYLKQVGVLKIATYPEAFEALPGQAYQNYLKLTNKWIYDIEGEAMGFLCGILSKIMRLPGCIKSGIKQVWNTSLKAPRQDENRSLSQYLFFTKPRILSIFLFVHCYKTREIKNSNEISKELLLDLADILGETVSQFKEDLKILLRHILTYFIKISKTASSDSSLINNQSFIKAYFLSSKHPNLLFSLDAFLLRFVINSLCELSNEGFDQTIAYFIDQQLKKLLVDFRQQVDEYHNSQGLPSNKFLAVESVILCLHSFVNLINESLFSDLVELVILSRFEELLDDKKFEVHHTRLMDFYKRSLKSLTQQTIPISRFRDLIRYLFSKENKVLNAFISSPQSNRQNDWLSISRQPKDAIQELVGLQFYYSLRFKRSNVNVKEAWIKYNSRQRPMTFTPKYGLTIFVQRGKCHYLEIVSQMLQKCMQIRQSQHNIINDLTKELKRMLDLTKSIEIHQYFSSDFTKLFVKSSLNDSGKTLSVFSFIDVSIGDQLQSIRKNSKRIKKRQSASSHSSGNQGHNFQSNGQSRSGNLLQSSLASSQQQSQPNQAFPSNNFPQKCPVTTIQVQAPTQCSFGEKCLCVNQPGELYWLCYVKMSNMHSIYSIHPDQRILAFTTCGHVCHQQCFETYKLQGCSKCRKMVNFLIPYEGKQPVAEQTTEKSQHFDRVLQQLCPLVGPNNPGIEIFRSVVVFLAKFLVVAELSYLRKEIPVYRYLFRGLQRLKQSFSKANQDIIIIEDSSVSKNAYLLNYIVSKLKDELKLSVEPKKDKVQKDHAQYLSKIIAFLVSSNPKCQVAVPASSQVMLKETRLYKNSLKLLPGTLSQLQKHRSCRRCQTSKLQTMTAVFYIFLTSHSSQDERFCDNCLKKRLSGHSLDKKLSQGLLICTENGTPLYFLVQGDRRFECGGRSIYEKLGQPYETGKMEDPEEFSLSQYQLQKILWSLIVGSATLSGKPADK